mmetsp:Transcript_10846/g.16514  ORF Transcript_10846/g.16514 Transcript_10846/m.16514 type:complete len:100 (+) Transcript_10846:75-374(+)|eukprot:CAMPEP_0185018486 /NCGR_PEP_ID=MMETSP1103-20130426/1196_1 /TAXON_ID=36769 /ORGANISM="Paraphysomonas bandaiensis, Strain Caron Lab Isolate" /LENGTH=99 /DNA_ID=CAMNT_0027548315 /DNA_START=37 /DNA_END=336 /DNA_ORIENTATION=+
MSLARKLLPLADRVLVRRILPQTKTAGGILLPESKIAKSSEGEVLSVGPGYRAHNGDLVAPSVSAGDKVLLPEFGGVHLKSEGEEIYLFRNDEILAKIE